MIDRQCCPICASRDARLLWQPKNSPGPVVRCRQCDLVYVSPIVDDHALIKDVVRPNHPATVAGGDLSQLAGCWEVHSLSAREAEWPAVRVDALRALGRISRYISTPGSLLDFGCGWGFFLAVAKENGWEPYGLEPLPGHALYASVQSKAQVITDILRDDTFPCNSFDVITSFQVFEHLSDPFETLERLGRCLRPEGIILIEVPNIDTWSVRIFGKHHRHFVPDHVTFFSRTTLVRLLEKAGFQVCCSYSPTRHLTLRHLAGYWGGRYLPSLSGPFVRLLCRAGVNSQVVGVNLGDIIGVIARKPLSF